MGKFLATWHRAISTATIAREFAPPRPASWPDALTHGQLAALQYPFNATEADKRRFADVRARYILDCCKSGALPHTAETTNKMTSPAKTVDTARRVTFLGAAAREAYTVPAEYKEVTIYTVTAPAFAAWLSAQGEAPSDHIAAWFEAVGVNPQPVAATDEPIEARNDRWLAYYEADVKADGKLGAYARGSKHFNVDRSTYNKAVKKAADKRAEKQRAGFKAVPAKSGGWGSTLVRDGKKTKGTKA